MRTDEIKELINLVIESGIAELEVQRGEDRVRIRRSLGSGAAQEIAIPAAAMQPFQSPSNNSVFPSPASAVLASGDEPPVDPKVVTVKSPIVGTYYDAPSPGAAEFVKIGDTIRTGQVLCIIESMKLMNEIEAEVSGILTAKLVENGSPVEYGEALFTIRQP
jgi:acetyl-CoA carboxylase biotin carboxyl carrier protein